MDDRLIVLDRTLRLLAEHVTATPTEIAAALGRTTVAIRVATELSLRRDAQAAAATLANLLARSGLRVLLDDSGGIPARTPLLRGALTGGLVELGEGILPGAVSVSPGEPADIAVVIGAGPAPIAGRHIWLVADRSRGGFAEAPGVFDPSDVLGAMEPASMIVSECIRFALRHLPPRSRNDIDWLAPIADARLPSPSVPPGLIDVGDVDAISAGAITDSTLWVIRARGQVTGRLRIFDDGHYEISNLNRYPLLDRIAALAGLAKAEHLASLAIADLELVPVHRRFTRGDRATARRRIIIGADDIEVRHIAQEAGPDWLAIGATGHDEARVTEHEPDESCARCAHPHLEAADDTPIPTIAPVSFQAGLRLASRLLSFGAGQATAPGLRYATYWPLRPGSSSVGPTPAHPACPLHGSGARAA